MKWPYFYILLVGAGLQALWQLTHVAADQLHHLIDDTQLFHFPPDLQIFCLSWAKYACNSRWHSSQGPSFLWDTKGGKRQVLVCYAGSIILLVLVCPYESQFVHAFVCTQLSLKCYSCWLPENSVSTPDTKITAFIDSSSSSNCLNSNLNNWSPIRHH